MSDATNGVWPAHPRGRAGFLSGSRPGHGLTGSVECRILCRSSFPTTSLATVYKTLSVLKEIDEVLELGFSGDDNRYDGKKPYPHPHLICIRCQKILDPEVTLALSLIQEVAQSSGYQILGHRLDFYGLCPDCQNST